MKKLTNCDVVASISSQDYHFSDVDTVTVDEPKTNTLTRGMSAKNKVGFVIEQNMDQPTVVTTTVKGLDKNTSAIFKELWKNKTRFDFNVVDSDTGDKCYAKNCILSENPIQKTISNEAETYNIDLIMHTFDYTED